MEDDRGEERLDSEFLLSLTFCIIWWREEECESFEEELRESGVSFAFYWLC